MEAYWLEVAKKIQALAQSGLAYSNNKYDIERYEELRNMSIDIMSRYTDMEYEHIRSLFANETGYQTPKVDVRAVVFKDGKILMVKEQVDGCWSLPGGWADIGYSPGEVAVKEVREEAGLEVLPVRLLAVLDKKYYLHPPSPYHTYKIFILCRIVGGEMCSGMETSAVDFFDRHALPPLSVERNTASQLESMFAFLDDPAKEVLMD